MRIRALALGAGLEVGGNGGGGGGMGLWVGGFLLWCGVKGGGVEELVGM